MEKKMAIKFNGTAVHKQYTDLVERGRFETAINLMSQTLKDYETGGIVLTEEQIASFESAQTAASLLKLKNEEHLRLEDLAYRDGLTGLLNFNYLEPRLERMFSRVELDQTADHENDGFTLFFLDVNFLKTVNDFGGATHETGDILLKGFASFLEKAVRPEDFVIRKHGDEFLILAQGKVGSVVMESILKKIEAEEVDIKGVAIPLRTAIGFAEVNGQNVSTYDGWQAVINEADTRMNIHKAHMKQEAGLKRESTMGEIIAYRDRLRAIRDASNDNSAIPNKMDIPERGMH